MPKVFVHACMNIHAITQGYLTMCSYIDLPPVPGLTPAASTLNPTMPVLNQPAFVVDLVMSFYSWVPSHILQYLCGVTVVYFSFNARHCYVSFQLSLPPCSTKCVNDLIFQDDYLSSTSRPTVITRFRSPTRDIKCQTFSSSSAIWWTGSVGGTC